MNLVDEIDELMVGYSSAIESDITRINKTRKFKCGFCSITFKYQTILIDHVYTQEIFSDLSHRKP